MSRARPGWPATTVGSESTRETILITASQVFIAQGYEQASMDEIALKSGVARRTLYNHFASKKALFDATMVRLWEHMPLAAIVDVSVESRPPAEVLYETGRAIADFWAPPEAVAFLRLVIWESARFPELTDSFMNIGREPARGAVKRYVRLLSKTPDFDINDPDLAASQFIDVILGEILLDRLVASRHPALSKRRCDYVVREAVALFLSRYRVQTS
ncbi:TetR/AcrR family transcriptional regulator [Mycolicibacterium mengxianglii]|uniref:TetR/AcrR family transcriptional regulator n=1 Tax=Mycolicibacterium mengxianglii TaxID=2736649 RepID=UPI0018D12B11|nr:TetR/AcrR family transcriptional regulator [Mycolicibacterium mengxianglii]